MKKVIYVISGLLSICTAVNAGGLLTNTNQNETSAKPYPILYYSCFLITIGSPAVYIFDF